MNNIIKKVGCVGVLMMLTSYLWGQYCVPQYQLHSQFTTSFVTTGCSQDVAYNTTASPSNSYADSTAMIIEQSRSAYVNFTHTYSHGQNSGIRIWVDWNDDGVFSKDELVYGGLKTDGTPIEGNFFIPLDAPLGEHRMRVRSTWTNNLVFVEPPQTDESLFNACDVIARGSAVDYTLRVAVAPGCVPITDLTVQTMGNAWSYITWSSQNATPETEWEVAWGQVGFTPGDNNQIGNFIVSNGVADTVITGLSGNGNVEVYVRAKCSSTSISEWTSIIYNTSYCTPQGFTSSSGYYIASATTTGATLDLNYTTSTPQPYVDATGTHVVVAEQNSSFDLKLHQNISSARWGIWIDANKNGLFSDPDEHIYAPTFYVTDPSIAVTIPSNMPQGSYRIRVANDYLYAIPDPCGEASNGGFVDFTLLVVAPGSVCLPIKNLVANTVTHNSMNVAWESNNTTPETQWEVVWGTTDYYPINGVSGFVGSQIVNGTPSAVINALIPETDYEIYVRAVCDSDQSIWSNISITTEPTCKPVAGIVVSNIALPQANVTWNTQNIIPETEWNVSWGIAGYTPGSNDDIANVLVTDGADTIITGLLFNNSYYVYVRAVCSPGDTSVWIKQLFETKYCPPIYTSGCSFGSKIKNIVSTGAVVDLENETGDESCGTDGYNDFAEIELKTTPGDVFNLEITVGSYDGWVKAWIDWNDNLIFEEDELILESDNIVVKDISMSKSFTVPANASIGEHRMRVRVVEGALNSVFTACSSQSYGEVEDYTLTVLDSDECLQVKKITTPNITDNSVDIAWNTSNNPAETEWEVAWGTSGFLPNSADQVGSFIVVNGTDTTVHNLTPETAYDVYVRAICGVGDTSIWIHTTVTTKPSCLKVKDVQLVNITSGTANIVWEASNTTPETEWEVVWGTPGFTIGTNAQIDAVIVSNGADTSLINLPNNQAFDVYIRAICSATDTSYAEKLSVLASLCVPVHTSGCSQGANISKVVTTGAISNIENTSACSNGDYTNNPDLAIRVINGNTVTMSVTVASYNGGVKAWIDWNNNNQFEDNEIVMNSPTVILKDSTYTESFTVPDNAIIGNHSVRIRVVEGNTSFNSCSMQSYGEYEEYTLIVLDPANCLPVTNFVASNLQANFIDLTWNSINNPAETQWQLSWGPPGYAPGDADEIGNVIVSDGADTTITTTPKTSYQLYIRSICAPGDTSALWIPLTVKTLPTCVTVKELEITSVGNGIISIAWESDNVTPETEWKVVWGKPGFTPYDTNQVGSFIVSNGADTTIVGLIPDGVYDIYVRANCSNTDSSAWTSINAIAGYCTLNYLHGCSNGAKIEHVKTTGAVINVENISGGGTTCGTGGYNNFTNMAVVATPGTTVSMEVKVASYNGGVKAWIDWNNNNIFEDDEIVMNSATSVEAGATYTESFTVSSILGTYRMRVRVVEGGTNFTSCSSEFYGEVEDYSFTVILPNACVPITNIEASNITSTTFDIAWDTQNLTPETEWEVVWGTPGFTIGTDGQDGQVGSFTVSNGADTTITNLAASSTYEVYVRAVCSNTNKSLWTLPGLFTTQPSCLPVTDIVLIGTALPTANIVWKSSNTTPETEWEVVWGTPNFTIGTDGANGQIGSFTVSNGADTTLYGLPNNGTYQAYVRAVCSSTDKSTWTSLNVVPSMCTPNYMFGCSSSAKIEHVKTTGAVINVENISGGGSTCGTDGYNNFTNMVVVATQGTTISMEVKVATYTGGVKAWIDWNNNNIFEDDEIVMNSATSVAAGTTYTESFTVSTILGTHKMRVRVVQGTTTFTSCSGEYYGEVEDYSFTVILPNACVPIKNLDVSNITSTTFDIAWDAQNLTPETEWEVVWGTPGFTIGTDGQDGQVGSFTVSNGADTTIANLAASSTYAVYVRAVCSSTNKSSWESTSITTQATCVPVTGIVISSVSTNEAEIVWSSQNSTPETEWNVSWGPAGYTIGDGDEIGSVTVSNGSDTTLYDLTQGSGYQVYVRAVCTSSDMSEWTLLNVSAQYCTPTYSGNCSIAAKISKVSITNAIVNLEHQTGTTCNNNYSNYTDKSVVVAKGATNVTMEVKVASYSGGVKAWVDWNNNLAFDADELIFESSGTILSGDSLTQSFDVPINAPLGTHRLRVRVVESSGSFTACDNYYYGEVEDYTLIIVDPTECAPVKNLTVGNLTQTSCDLNWETTNTTPETAWEVVWGEPGFTIGADGQDGQIGSFIVSNGADTTITGLTAGESYSVYVRAVCDVGDTSIWRTVNVLLNYCTPNASLSTPYSEKFQTMGAVNNVDYTASSNAPNGYKNLTATDTIKQVQGAYVQFTHKISSGFEVVRIWIDWNNNYTFEDNEEVFFDYNTTSNAMLGSFYIPSSATPGAYKLRMRAVRVQNTSDFEADACATYASSTALDYTLEVIECNVGPGQISGDTVLCLGLPGQLVSTETLGTASWSSSDPTKVTVTLDPNTNAGIISALAIGQATLKYVLKAPNGCNDSTTVDVNVVAPYTVNITDSPSNDSLLKGTNYTYASDGVLGTWSSTNAFIASVDPTSGKVTALLAGETDIVYTETHTCSISTLKHLTVYEKINEGGGTPEPCPNPPCDNNGIDEIDFVSNVSLFPNPATSTVNVEFSLLYAENVSIKIVDLNGKVMYTQSVPTAVVGINTVELNLAKYANGVYSVIVRSNEALTTKKLVISK